MAETAVCSLIDKLLPLLTAEVNLLRGIHQEVSEIKSELVSIRALLKDADRKAEVEGEISEGVQAWVEDLKNVAFRIEDVVDEYAYHMTLRHPSRHQFIAFVNKIAGFLPKLKPKHHVATQIQEIKATVRGIKDRSGRYGFDSLQFTSTAASRSWTDHRKASLYIKSDEVVGFEIHIKQVIKDLVCEDNQRIAVSVVGMGGLGKTTLAKQVFDRVKERFDCHAWVQVSESYSPKELLKNLIIQFCEANNHSTPTGIENMDEHSLTEHLRKYLEGKKYVVVFDDVWKDDFWADVEHALLENGSGGRILITTRKNAVANSCRRSSKVSIHQLKHLPPVKAMELFCKKVFQFECGGLCPLELRKLSHDIVNKCQGLPLAIVAVAGLLSSKEKTVFEWKKLHESLSSESISIARILSLSYNDLPYNLKCCLLYFGMFTKGYRIRCGRLIREWIAEGFVKSGRGKTLEVVAKEYLAELVDRSLVEISNVDDQGKAKRCRVHDLLHDVIFQKMEGSSFGLALPGNELSNFKGVIRRLFVNSSNDILKSTAASRVRCIFVHDEPYGLGSMRSSFATNFKLLKVLDFENAPRLDHLPEDIGDLLLLRYLSVRGTRVERLPKSIGRLVNLETLDLKRSMVQDVPAEICELIKLRHLFASLIDYSNTVNSWGRVKGINVGRIGSLKALQKIYYIDVDGSGVGIMKELRILTQLRTLGLMGVRSGHGRSLCSCIEMMTDLESLGVESTDESEIIDLESMSHPPEFLRRLYLTGPVRKLPEWIATLQSLEKIAIRASKLKDDPLKVLRYLHNLVELEIGRSAFDGEQLHFEDGVFPKLKVLRLADLSGLNSLIIEEGALYALEKLHLGPLPQLKDMPSSIKKLRNLKFLWCRYMPNEFVASVDPNRGHSYHIVEHVVPFVYFQCKDEQGQYNQTYRLHKFGFKPF